MDLRQVSCFVAAYESGSISRAAETLYVSQQAASHSLRELERSLGADLFERSTSGISPTHLAHEIIADARRILKICETIEAKARDIAGTNKRVLRMGYANGTFSVGDSIKIWDLRKYICDCLGMDAVLTERTQEECEKMLALNQLDMACLFNPDPNLTFACTVLRRYPVCIGMNPAHPLSQKSDISFDDLAQYPIIGNPSDPSLNRAMTAITSHPGFSPKVYYPSAQLSILSELMRQDLALIIFTEPFVRAFGGKDVVLRPFPDPSTQLNLCVLRHNDTPGAPQAKKVAAFLAAFYKA